MEKAKFFRFTIQGDDLELEKIGREVNLPCSLYKKGDVLVRRLFEKEYRTYQKTNRWVYDLHQIDTLSVSKFLTNNLQLIYKNLRTLKQYIVRYKTSMKLIVYADNNTDIQLSKQQIKLLSAIGVKFSISFC